MSEDFDVGLNFKASADGEADLVLGTNDPVDGIIALAYSLATTFGVGEACALFAFQITVTDISGGANGGTGPPVPTPATVPDVFGSTTYTEGSSAIFIKNTSSSITVDVTFNMINGSPTVRIPPEGIILIFCPETEWGPFNFTALCTTPSSSAILECIVAATR